MPSPHQLSLEKSPLQSALKRSWGLAWPLILANASLPLMGAVDTAVAGRLQGPEPLAAIALGASWVALVFWAFGFLRIAVGGIAAQLAGAKDVRGGCHLLAQALCLAVVLGLSVGAGGYMLASPLLEQLDLEPLLAQKTAAYLDVRFIGAVLALAMYACHGWLMGQGNTRALAIILVLVNVLNMGLSVTLGIGLELGVAGIAAATVASQMVGVLAAFWLIRSTLAQQGQTGWIRPRLQGIRKLLNANGWVLVRALALMAVFAWFNTQSALLSPLDAAANAILLTLLSVAAYALDGFADAAEIETGQALGQRNTARLKYTFYAAAICSFSAAGLASLVLWLGQDVWLSALTNQLEIFEASQTILWWLIPMPLVAWLSYYFDGIFIGAHAFRPMALIMLFSSATYFGLWWLNQNQGLAGLWIAFWGFQVIRATAMAAFFRVRLWPDLKSAI